MTEIEQQRRRALEQIAEVKRILCANEHALKHQVPATLLVTSALPNEGKTLFAAALAAAAAQSGRYRVAALDLNWHRPALHRYFDVTQEHSAQALCEGELATLLRPSGQESLSILTAPQDSADQVPRTDHLFTIPERLIRQARETHDLVVIDSASVFPTNRMMMDPVLLSGVVDGVLMVILTAVTPRQQVRRAQTVMEAAGARILGAVANHWKLSVKK
jgi:Mrp family chromosome partitioning ATPase